MCYNSKSKQKCERNGNKYKFFWRTQVLCVHSQMLPLVGESDGGSEGRGRQHADCTVWCFLTYYYILILNYEVTIIISSLQMGKP